MLMLLCLVNIEGFIPAYSVCISYVEESSVPLNFTFEHGCGADD